jgi:hypothetical protein
MESFMPVTARYPTTPTSTSAPAMNLLCFFTGGVPPRRMLTPKAVNILAKRKW